MTIDTNVPLTEDECIEIVEELATDDDCNWEEDTIDELWEAHSNIDWTQYPEERRQFIKEMMAAVIDEIEERRAAEDS